MKRWVPRSRAGTFVRFFAAAIIVIAAGAATTAVAGLLQVKNLANDLSDSPSIVTPELQLPKPGAPQTILLIGSDHRKGVSLRKANTDTMLLVRLNAKSSTINVMSIPRDLRVDIPGHGIDKINAAYSEGGYGLLIRTIRKNVFPDLHPNHIVDTNFQGFSDLVDAIGCVYSDVDRRYYNDTAYTNYSSIDVQPGYQRLCGHNQSVSGALPFVRFRHTDSDLVRAARQQDFLRWAKEQYPIGKLLSNRDRLLRIFGKHSFVDKDLKNLDGLINLFNLVAFSDGNAIRQVEFPADLAPCTAQSCFVDANRGAERAAFARFMAATPRTKAAKAKATPKSAKGHGKITKLDTNGLSPDIPNGRSQVAQLGKVKMPVYFPKLIKTGSSYCLSLVGNCSEGLFAAHYLHSYPRQYVIPDRDGHKRPAYRMTVAVNPVMGQYYGVQGVAWKNPPLLQHPSGTRTINGRKLFLYADGGRLTTVAWHRGNDSYWIANTLTSALPNSQMVALAASMIRGRP